MLATTLGPGKAQVQVNADLNVDKTTQKSLTYAKKGVPQTTSSDVEKLKGAGATAGGTAGTGSQHPDVLQRRERRRRATRTTTTRSRARSGR